MAEGEDAVPLTYPAAGAALTLPGLAVLAVKLLGLYSFITAIPYAFYLPAVLMFPSDAGAYELVNYLMPLAAHIALGVMLLFNAEWVVARIVKVPLGDVPPASFDEHAQAVAFSLVGVVLMTWGIAGTAHAVAQFIATQRASAIKGNFELTWIIDSAVYFAAGTVLFLRGRGLAALWHRLRYAGLHNDRT